MVNGAPQTTGDCRNGRDPGRVHSIPESLYGMGHEFSTTQAGEFLAQATTGRELNGFHRVEGAAATGVSGRLIPTGWDAEIVYWVLFGTGVVILGLLITGIAARAT